jgi:hypothetical protein
VPEGNKLDVLATLIAAYESRHYRVPDRRSRRHSPLRDRVYGPLAGRACDASWLARPRVGRAEQEAPSHGGNDAKISEAWRIPVEALARPYNLATDALRL